MAEFPTLSSFKEKDIQLHGDQPMDNHGREIGVVEKEYSPGYSSAVSASDSTTRTPPTQHRREESNSLSSSGDSTDEFLSRSGSTSISSPQQHLFGKTSQTKRRIRVSHEKGSETDSAKVNRIFYDPSTSSSSDESIRVSPWNSIGSNSNRNDGRYEGKMGDEYTNGNDRVSNTPNSNHSGTGTSPSQSLEEEKCIRARPKNPKEPHHETGNNESSIKYAERSVMSGERPTVDCGDQAGRKSSRKWRQTEIVNSTSLYRNEHALDDLHQEPTSLSFNHFHRGETRYENQMKKFPEPQNSDLELKRAGRAMLSGLPSDNEVLKFDASKGKHRKRAKDKMQLTFSQIIVTQQQDDDSTLGTEGTYLERFPKRKKEKELKSEKQATSLNVSNLTRTTENKEEGSVTEPVERSSPVEIRSTQYRPLQSKDSEEKADVNEKVCPIQTSEVARDIQKAYQLPITAYSETSGNNEKYTCDRSDPPGEAFLFLYDPRALRNQRYLHKPHDSTRSETVDGSGTESTESTSVELGVKSGSFVTSPHETQRNFSSSVTSSTSWVPPNMEGRGKRIDFNPTRIYINSLITGKRSSSPNHLPTDDQYLKYVAGEYAESRTLQSHDIETTDTLASPTIDSGEARDAPQPICSSSNSQDKFYCSDSSTSGVNDSNSILNSEYLQNPSRPDGVKDPETSLYENRSSNSDATDLRRESHRTVPFLQNEESGNSKLYTSSSSPSSQQSSKQSNSSGRCKTIALSLCSALLIITVSIVVVVLWRLGILFTDENKSSSATPLPTPTSQSPLMSSTKAPNANLVIEAPTSVPLEQDNVTESPEQIMNDPSIAQSENDIELSNLISQTFPQGLQALQSRNSPQWKALRWLGSSTNSGISTEKSLQRFVLATFYYSTNGDAWENNAAWLSESDECTWMSTADTVCDEEGNYVKLDLKRNNLVGSVPPELAMLSNTLQTIDLRENSLSGELPSPTISVLSNLRVLDLSSNAFSGELYPQLFDATSLTRLSLFQNNLTSSIPRELGQLTELGVLDLGSNRLSAPMPSTIGMLSKLAGLSLFDNMLSGTLPSELSNLQMLDMLYIDSNSFESPLPTGICLLELEEFWSDCEEIRCTCCTTCCSDNFGCFAV